MPAGIEDNSEPDDCRSAVLVSTEIDDSLNQRLAGRLLTWLTEVLSAEFADSGGVTVMLQTDAEIADLNRRFRNRPRPTDVLSFPGGESGGDGRHLGDVAISLQTAMRQAADEGHSLFEELRLLTLHGLLHCAGYDHETDEGEMDRLELELRDKWLTDDA